MPFYKKLETKWIIGVVFVPILVGLIGYWGTRKNDTSKIDQLLEIINRQLRPVYFDLSVLWPVTIAKEDGTIFQIQSEPITSDEDHPFGRRSSLDQEAIEKLDSYVKLLKELNIRYILLIEGHTSKRLVSANVPLSRTRVLNVMNYLVAAGVPRDSIKTASHGGAEWDKADKEYCERVEFKLISKE